MGTGRARRTLVAWMAVAAIAAGCWAGGGSATSPAQLYTERGAFIAQDGDLMTFGQIRRESATGTFDDPYVLSRIWQDGTCYVRAG